MKSTLLTAAIVIGLSLAGTSPVFADEPAAAGAEASWSIQAPPVVQKALAQSQVQIDAAENTPQAKGTTVAMALREAGFISAVVAVKPGNVIEVSLARPVFSGEYAAYFSQGEYLTKRQLEAGAVKASNRAKADGKSVKIDVRTPADGVVEVVASAADVDDWKRWGASAGFNNYGSRYSGSDLLTGYARVALEDGNEVSASVAHGLSNTNPDSYGGRYEAASVSWTHNGPHGATRVEFSNAVYTAGGPVRVFDLTGRVTTLSVGHWVPLSAKWQVYGQIVRTENRQHLGVVSWKDQTNYTTATVGVERNTPATTTRLSIDKGLGGSRDFNVVPLLGTFDPHYTTLKIDWQGRKTLNEDGWVLRGAAGAHVGTSDTPSNEQFSAGGPGRGRAWLTGSTSGKRGAYGEVIIEAPTHGSWTPYVGLDTSIVDPQVGNSQRLSSAFVGTRYSKNNWNLDAGYAHGVGSNDLAGAQKDSRIFLNISRSW